MKNENLKIEITEGVRELIIREGAAPEHRYPNPVIIVGNIDAPALFFEARKDLEPNGPQAIDMETAILYVDEKAMSLELLLNPHDPYGKKVNVTGILKLAKDLETVGVFYGSNCTPAKTYRRNDFRKFLTFNRRFFKQDEAFANLLAGIGKLEMAIQQVANETSNNRGEFDNAASRTIKSNLPQFVTLNHKIFEGQAPMQYDAEVCYDIEDRTPVFWLESPDLAELIETTSHEILKGVIQRLPDVLKIVK